MGKIVILDQDTANKIAAGEVVEKPASVVKELMENSIDAGATSISVEIKNGGITYIKIVDNGSGIASDDVEIAFEKHSTSKIRHADDLNSIGTLGFRGEALASIGAVSKMTVVTKTLDDEVGSKVIMEGGVLSPIEPIGTKVGTSITVENLFFNTPARYKFLKKDYTEAGYIEEVVEKLALSHPEIAFKYINNGKTIIQTPGNGDLFSATYSIFGKVAESTIPVEYQDLGIKVTGLVGKAETARSNRNMQIFFINKRAIKNKTISAAVEEAYRTIVAQGKYAFVVLNIDINSEFVDVNVHPTKQEVRFSDEGQIFRAVFAAVKNAFTGKSLAVDYTNNKVTQVKPILTFNETKEAINLESENDYKIETEKPKFNISSEVSMNLANALKDAFTTENINTGLRMEEVTKEKKVPTTISQIENTFKVDIPVLQHDILGRQTENLVIEQMNTNEMNIKIVGVVFDTYIIVESNDIMYMIDQHAAHERVMYEKLLREYRANDIVVQTMFIPEVVDLTNKEMDIAKNNKEYLKKLGLEYEEFGGNTLKINTIPSDCSESSVKDLFLQIIDEIANGERRTSNLDERILYTMACKAAVKAHYVMKEPEIVELIKSMQDADNPYTCPHGRPTIIQMDINEIERKFKRR